MTPFSTPGAHDRNVAIAWTQWLQREDDSPQSILDAAMNGLAAGCVCGGGADLASAVLWRMKFLRTRDASLSWTRSGAALGCGFSMLFYFILSNKAAPPGRMDGNTSSQLAKNEVMSDPWSSVRGERVGRERCERM